MKYYKIYKTPDKFDNILLESDGEYLTKLIFSNEEKNCENEAAFKEVEKWLDIYFSGVSPEFTPKYKLENLTPFCISVINEIKNIPFGETLTYGDIASSIAKKRNMKRMSAQAVGGGLNKNPICLIIPCHRIIGKNKKLVGFGGGINNKAKLLDLEKINYEV